MKPAPTDYIENYFFRYLEFWRKYPDERALMIDALHHVSGDIVINIGCGPQFYDYVKYFDAAPKRYIGIDINTATFDLLQEPHIVEIASAKRAVETSGVDAVTLHSDVLEIDPDSIDRAHTVLAVGFVATYHGDRLQLLLSKIARMLRPAGRLVTVSWHGPHRTPEETQKKLAYGFDSLDEHTPESLERDIARAGFSLVARQVLCPSDPTYGWDYCHSAIFDSPETGRRG